MSDEKNAREATGFEIAIIGMACRFPGASNLGEFWSNLAEGVESLTHLSPEELRELGELEASLTNPNYVPVARTIEDSDLFDAAFFGINPREAEVMDPQQRHMLELGWEAVENAGYNLKTYNGLVGIYAGCKMSNYIVNLISQPEVSARVGDLQIQIGNDKDYIATRIAYKLGLKGPAVTVQSACSTSLVATHLACQTLLSGECDMALAGGINLRVPQVGYLFREGEIYSPDGRIRSFSDDANGTIFGNGLGMVVLKRLEDARADGDNIRAVILGSAVNNDGTLKAGFTAPGADGQQRVIRAAQDVADVHPDSISYIETHGTGTPTGDPIEVTALTAAFREKTQRQGYCAIGSVKTNVGHLSSAAGAAGLIKTVLAMEHQQLPASLNHSAPNSQINFEASPFFVNTELRPWRRNGDPRRAGVSAFGIGGTNAHLIVEESQPEPEPAPSRPWQLLTLSGRTESALDNVTSRLAELLQKNSDISFPDVAFTLQLGRQAFEHRRTLVCRDRKDALSALAPVDGGRLRGAQTEGRRREVAFLFSGQGAQYAGMGQGLYEEEKAYRETIDLCCEKLEPLLGHDLREWLHPEEGSTDVAAEKLRETRYTQPALFVVEYATAQLWRSWGMEPDAMIGHSIGEYVAACLAGVFSLDDGLRLVAARGRLMHGLPSGAMLAVPLSEEELAPYLGPGLSIAALNAPGRSVVAGPHEAIEACRESLRGDGVSATPLQTSHAFHSQMMDPILPQFVEEVSRVELKEPRIPYISNVSGTWITAEEATDPNYWALHLRRGVRFADGVGKLLEDDSRILLEIGPGKTLATLSRRHPGHGDGHVVASSIRHPKDLQTNDLEFILATVGQLWRHGRSINFAAFYSGESRRRVELPTYPFERRRFWIEAGDFGMGQDPAATRRKEDLGDWFYLPGWHPSIMPAAPQIGADKAGSWLVFSDPGGRGDALVQRLEEAGETVAVALQGAAFEDRGERRFTLAADSSESYDNLLQSLTEQDFAPDHVVHLWTFAERPTEPLDDATSDAEVAASFWSLLYLLQAFGKSQLSHPIQVAVVSHGLQILPGDDGGCAERATLLGPLQVGPQEYANLTMVHVDTELPAPDGGAEAWIDQVLAEINGIDPQTLAVAYRHRERWVRSYHAAHVPPATQPRLRLDGVYLITGGLGGIGLTFAEFLAQEYQAKLVLLGVTPLPPREQWRTYLDSQPASDRLAGRIRKVLQIEELGGKVLVLAADVTDREQMRRVIDQAREHFGPIHGVIHTAGLAGGGLVQLKTSEAAARVLAPKIRGTRILTELLRGDPLDFHVLCSSTIAVFGTLGQVDYCAANNFLDLYAASQTLAGGPVTLSINWGAWEEVGMAVAAGLVGPGGSPATAAAQAPPPSHPLLDRSIMELAEMVVYETDLDPERHWVLSEHRIGGTPALPGTSYLEIARGAFQHYSAAFESTGGLGAVELSEVMFFTPLIVPEGETRLAQTTLEREGDFLRFRVSSPVGFNPNGEPRWQPHVVGKVQALADSAATSTHDPNAIIARCNEKHWQIEEEVMTDGGLVTWGPRWQSLREIHLGDGEAISRLEFPQAFAADDEPYVLHPATLDVATGMLSFLQQETFLPLSYGKVQIHGPLVGTIFSYLARTESSTETVVADFILMNEDGVELVHIERFAMKRVDLKAADGLKTSPPAAQPATRGSSAGPPQGGGPTAVGQVQGGGIFPHEGVEILRRTLATTFNRPQAVISVRDFNVALKQVRSVTRGSLSDAGGGGMAPAIHPRPELATAYEEPRNPIEKKLTDVWKEVLGLEQVGIHDNFFELGGDSVVGVQVVSQAKEKGLDLSPDQLFQHQTVAELAQVPGLDEQSEGADEEDWTEDEDGDETDLEDAELAKVYSQLEDLEI